MTEKISIDKKYYDTLKRAMALLQCLQECGVDNWEGYSEAQQLFAEMYPDEEEETDDD